MKWFKSSHVGCKMIWICFYGINTAAPWSADELYLDCSVSLRVEMSNMRCGVVRWISILSLFILIWMNCVISQDGSVDNTGEPMTGTILHARIIVFGRDHIMLSRLVCRGRFLSSVWRLICLHDRDLIEARNSQPSHEIESYQTLYREFRNLPDLFEV